MSEIVKKESFWTPRKPDIEELKRMIKLMEGNRTDAEYANQCNYSTPTFSRMLRGLRIMSKEDIERLYAHRDENCNLSFEEVLHANGMLTDDEINDFKKESSSRSNKHEISVQEYEDRIDNMKDILIRDMFNLGVYMSNVPRKDFDDCEKPKMILSGEWVPDLVISITEDRKGLIGCDFIPFKRCAEDTAEDDVDKVLEIFEKYTRLFLIDSWNSSRLLGKVMWFVFCDETYMKLFVRLLQDVKLNNIMFAVLVDDEERRLRDLEILGNKDLDEFRIKVSPEGLPDIGEKIIDKLTEREKKERNIPPERIKKAVPECTVVSKVPSAKKRLNVVFQPQETPKQRVVCEVEVDSSKVRTRK